MNGIIAVIRLPKNSFIKFPAKFIQSRVSYEIRPAADPRNLRQISFQELISFAVFPKRPPTHPRRCANGDQCAIFRSFRAREFKTHTFFFGRFTSCQSPFKSSTTQKGKDIWSVRAQKTFRTGQKTVVPLKVPSRDFYYLLAGGVASGVGVITEFFKWLNRMQFSTWKLCILT